MRLANTTYIIWGNLTERIWRTLAAVLVIAFAAAVVFSVFSFTSGFLRGVVDKAATVFPPSVLMVKPKTVSLAILAFNAGVIDQPVVDKIRAMPGVTDVSPQLSMKMPLRMEVRIAGQTATTDAVVVGVSPESVQGDVFPKYTFGYDAASTQPVPCIVPSFLLDMYNLAYADSMGLPKMNNDYLVGKVFKLILGETYLTGATGTKRQEVQCRVVGISSNPSLVAGVYIPLEHAEALNRWYNDKPTSNYTALQVTVGDLSRLDTVTSGIAEMNLTVQGNRETYDTVRFGTRAAGVVLQGFAAIIIIICTFTLFNMFSLIMASRRGEVKLLHAVGSGPGTVKALYMGETLALALVGTGLGIGAVWILLGTLENSIRSRIQSFSFMPDDLFNFSPVTALVTVLGAIVVCVAAPLLMLGRPGPGSAAEN